MTDTSGGFGGVPSHIHTAEIVRKDKQKKPQTNQTKQQSNNQLKTKIE